MNKGGRTLHKGWDDFEQIRDSKNTVVGAKCKICGEIVKNFGEKRMENHV
jgi:hypothetical protein